MTAPARVSPSGSITDLHDAIRSGAPILVSSPRLQVESDVVGAMIELTREPGVGSASPIPLASATSPLPYRQHPSSPGPPSLPAPCPDLCVFGAEALASLGAMPRERLVGYPIVKLGELLTQHGWRHVGTPGLAFAWNPSDIVGITPSGAWSAATIESLSGAANTGLEAHRSWASASVDQTVVVVDGGCISESPNTGTQHLVVEISRWLASVRPTAKVQLAVRRQFLTVARQQLSGAKVEVIERRVDTVADVVYRPYQMLYAGELAFVTGVGRRALVGQLDMIGFSNPFYHPTPNLFFFARNIQRHMMRNLDLVTFISEFGRDSALAECPDLEPRRLRVVSCGADPTPLDGCLGAERDFAPETRFLTCLSSTFWHKNRAHSISTFAQLVEHHGYEGDLVMAGPEPYYGRSLTEEEDRLKALDPSIRRRVHHWGHVADDEKWWLLRHADAVLYPSVVEGFGLVPFEAAAVGTPCLAYAGTAPGELLAGTEALIKTWSPAVWAERIAAVVDDRSAAQLNVEQISKVGTAHSWQASAQLTWEAIDHALALPRRQRHDDDGNTLVRIARSSERSATGSTLRFNVARGMPAALRRAERFWPRYRKAT